MKSNYCLECKFRCGKATNRDGFCEAGYTQNPRTEAATRNVIANSGIAAVCAQNPWKRSIVEGLSGRHVLRRAYEEKQTNSS